MKLIGYARVSTKDQSLDGQIEKIKKFCEYKDFEVEIFSEKVSAISERPEFDRAMEQIDSYDGIVVTSLDRLGRSVYQLSYFFKTMTDQEKKVIIIDQNIDTSTKEGRLLLNLLSSIAEFERELIRERLQAGKERSNKRDGRKRKELPKKDIIRMYENGAGYKYIGSVFGVSEGTIYRRLKEWNALKTGK